jgi:hypothetical protein
MRSHIRAIVKLGNRAIFSDSTKQKVNTRSSTKIELVAADETISKVFGTKKFIEAQSYKVNANIVYQDNTNIMKVEMNNIKFFYFTDSIKRREMHVKYYLTNEITVNNIIKLCEIEVYQIQKDT